MKQILIFILYLLTSTFGLYKIKLSDLAFNYNTLVGLISYGVGFIIWLIILKMNPLSIAFPTAASSLNVTTHIAGILLLNESLSITKIVGIILIIAGISLIFFEAK